MAKRLLSLDFDGVLYPVSPREVSPFEYLPCLVELLRDWPNVFVVVHSSWTETHPPEELAEFMSELGGNFVGAVGPGARADAILAYVAEHPEYQDILVIDDDHSQFPTHFTLELVLCNPRRGLADKVIQDRLREWLRREPAILAELDTANGTIEPLLTVLKTHLSAEELAEATVRIEEWRCHLASPDADRRRDVRQKGATARTVIVNAQVTMVIPEFEIVQLDVRDGSTISVGTRTPGVLWRNLVIGDELICVVARTAATRVLFAKRLRKAA